MQDDRVFTYVNFECVRRPTTNALYDVVGDALQGRAVAAPGRMECPPISGPVERRQEVNQEEFGQQSAEVSHNSGWNGKVRRGMTSIGA